MLFNKVKNIISVDNFEANLLYLNTTKLVIIQPEMKISTRARYGLRAILYLAKKKAFCSVREISENEKIPPEYLEKILLQLKNKSILKAKRGISGGFKLNQKLEKIKIKKILQILNPDFLHIVCFAGSTKNICPRQKDCLTQKLWLKIYQALDKTLAKLSIKNLLQD